MKNLKLLLSLQFQVIAGIVCLVLVFFDAAMTGARGISELSWVGQSLVGIPMLFLAYQVVTRMLIPVGRWVLNLVR